VSTMLPRRFALVHDVDYTGVSGIGVVAFGIAFPDGQVVLRWCSAHPATSTWDSLDDLLADHGHSEGTSIQWIDAPTTELADFPPVTGPGRRARRRVIADGTTIPAPPDSAADPSNGFARPRDPVQDPIGEMAVPAAQRPGRHRRASQLEQPV
jgi:hypothetical protein